MVVFPLKNDKSPAVPKGTNWQSYTGDVGHTDLTGVMIPVGVVVIDVDTHKGCTTQAIDEALGVSLDWESSELQSTLNGGMHYVFLVPETSNLSNATNALGVQGFDVRSSLKGYIATGRGYTNLTMIDSVVDALHDKTFWVALPDEAVNKLSSNTMTLRADDDSDLAQMLVAQPLELTQDEVLAYVSKLNDALADDSASWLKVGMALYHQSRGAEWGWDAFDDFSKRCIDKYDAKMNRKRWESFGKGSRTNPITFATIIDLAGGAKAVEAEKFDALINSVNTASSKQELLGVIKDCTSLKIDELNTMIFVKALQKQFVAVVGEKLSEAQVRRLIKSVKPKKHTDYYEDYVFLTSSAEYMDRITKVRIGQRAFDVKHDRDTPPDHDGNPQHASTFVQNKIDCVFDGMYAPMFGDTFSYDGVDYFNTFKPNVLERVKHGTTDIVDRIKGHIAHLLPDESEQALVINYLAHNVQFQGRKIQWAMILQGVQGDGKSFLAEMMKHVLGATNCRTVTVESLDEKFTGWAEGNCMVFIEELKLDNYKKYETLNKLKPYIANPTVSIRRMQRDVYECVNTTNYFALTNFKDALPIDANDRRYCVLFSQWQSKESLMEWLQHNPDYYSNLYDDMRKGVGEILDWLLTHKIDEKFLSMTRAPDTNAKFSMLEMSKSADYLLVEDAIEEFNCHDINHHVVNITRLSNFASDAFNNGYALFPKDSRLRNILLDMGYHNIGRYKSNDRKNYTIYCKDHKAKPIDFKNDNVVYSLKNDDEDMPF